MKNLNTLSCNYMVQRLIAIVVCTIFISISEGEIYAQNSSTATLKGVVLDESNEPLIGANVYVKSTTRGTVANETGEFSLEVLPGEIVVFTYVGHQIQEYTVPALVPEKLTIQLKYHAEIVAEPATDQLYSSPDKKIE